nr:hypothetical protein CFP56_33564 [Quercus suber]
MVDPLVWSLISSSNWSRRAAEDALSRGEAYACPPIKLESVRTARLATMTMNPARSKQKSGKLVTYGKGIARGYDHESVDSFFENDVADDSFIPSRSAWAVTAAKAKVKNSLLINKAERRTHPTKQVESRAVVKDTFDIPSSDEEMVSPTKRASSPRKRIISTSVDDNPGISDLASWERVGGDTNSRSTVRPRASRVDQSHPADQLQNELAREVARIPPTTSTATTTTKRSDTSTSEPRPIGAAARLAARKRVQNGNDLLHKPLPARSSSKFIKRAESNTKNLAPSLPKRGRTIEEVGDGRNGALKKMQVASGIDNETELGGTINNIFDVPITDDAKLKVGEMPEKNQQLGARETRRGKSTRKHSMPTKGVSAPARLHAMLTADVDSDGTDSVAQPHSVLMSGSSTPRAKSPLQISDNSSPRNALQESQNLTPKQVHAWNRILPTEQPKSISPGVLPMKDMKISTQRRVRTHGINNVRNTTATESDITEVPKKRRKLVDHLKAVATDSSSGEVSDEDGSDSGVRMMIGRSVNGPSVPPIPKNNVCALGPVPQGHSQPSNTDTGPRVTYARVRSYLPEDSFEEAMALDLPAASDQVRATSSLTGTNGGISQPSVFEPQDSDDETGPAKLRSIHELRAAGKTRGFMQDTESLMEDISNHNSSARGARRAALIEVVANMMDKAYVGRFIGHGFEHQLAHEFGAPMDNVGDFLLAVISSLILFDEPPQHTLTCLQQADVLRWLLQRLNADVDIRSLARDRRNNMSKASQADILTHVEMYKCHESLWEHTQPTLMTQRVAAMKSLELFIRRSRKLGDQTELLTTGQLSLMFSVLQPNASNASAVDISLLVSILESLAISTLPLAWPDAVTNELATLLPNLHAISDMPRHTTFLALRLTLNLTNGNDRNCAAFARVDTIQYFLRQLGEGFTELQSSPRNDDADRAFKFDLLILSLGIMTNLAEQNAVARDLTIEPLNSPTLTTLLATFTAGHERAAEAESMEETNSNVAFGYLAILLANLCQASAPRHFIAAHLPGKTLQRLVVAVEEFVAFHEKVDLLQSMQVFDEETPDAGGGGGGSSKDPAQSSAAGSGAEVWGAYTARFKAVLARLQAVA